MVFRSTKTAFVAKLSMLEANMGAGGDILLSSRIQILRTDRAEEFLNCHLQAYYAAPQGGAT